MIKEKGVKKVACITGSTANTDCAERLEGYKLALEDNDIACDESLICYANPSRACKEDFAAL
jgi:DNA-binding LacI/PurR family transcriptional regulator